jgi:hypothetical protein
MLVMFVVVFPLAFAACGGGGDKASEGAAGARIDCRADAFSGNPELPAKFPVPAEFTVTESNEEGPTRVVIGYWDSGIDEAHNEWKDRLEEAGFDVTFDELEDHDSEVAYKGSGRTGIVQLRDRCNEDEVTYVRITSRPE